MNSDYLISFEIEEKDTPFLEIVIDRVLLAGLKLDRMAMEMDLRACHANGCPLDFAKLAQADRFSLLHDVAGIGAHLNRRTGRLENHFLPRCAQN